MHRRPFLGLVAGALSTPALAQTGATQTVPTQIGPMQAFPDRPLRCLVPFPAGGATDAWARIATDAMQPELGQTFIVENRGGAGGLIGTEAAAKAPPDGYTLLFTITTHVTTPVVMKRFPYDPILDFAPIGRLATSNSPFVIGPRVPPEIRSWAEFAAWGRGRDLSFGTYAAGSTGHAFTLMLAEEAGLKAEVVIYRGEAPTLQDILTGQLHGGFMSMATGGEMVRAGRTRPLAASGETRILSLPEVPLLKELGFSNRFAFSGFAGLFAPARTPQPILDRLAEVFALAAGKPETRRRLQALDAAPAFLGPAAFKAQVAQSLREWTEIAERLNLTIEG